MTLDATITTTRPAPGTAVVAIDGPLDVYSAPDMRTALIALINEGRYRQVVDLTAVTFVDSTGLGVIVGAAKRAVAHCGRLALVVDLDGRVGKVLRITGVHKAIANALTVEEALALVTAEEPPTVPAVPEADTPKPSLWPPQPGDVWLGNLGERIPQALVCGARGDLYVGGDGMAPDRAYDAFGPLRLVWRDGAVVTAMHASELNA